MRYSKIKFLMREADAGAGGSAPPENVTPPSPENVAPPVPPAPPVKTFTQEEVTAMIQAELAKNEAEKERQKKMSKEQIEIEKRDKRIAELEYSQKVSDVEKKLIANKLPAEALEFIMGFKDDANLDDRIKKFQSIINSSNTTYANEVLGKSAPPPQSSSGTNNNTITREQFLKMSYTERVNLYNTNKELYNQLSKL